ncbi:HigA family addiction module antitoxin [Prosthecobacter dejongeii]|uniref:Addiction module HigA family antidote n=1 Tax=Prosthecobacter dejongeii TaxID=48465 RepID=A0A7W7YLQ1_9BACT|nr:HigA family addiction module antitoxin [Prosthecobacter dejongeii]MBB5038369.1 addiction module HigA family antidote [Prosthecobacter dejongeii]
MKTHLPIHPGEILQEEFLRPLGLSEYRLARDIVVSPRRINEIIRGQRALTADTALRLSRYFEWPAEVWLNLQAQYDRQIVEAGMQSTLALIKPYRPLVKTSATSLRLSSSTKTKMIRRVKIKEASA